MLSKWRLEITLGILVLLTIVAVLGEKYILHSTIVITPESQYTVHGYNDVPSGGNSSIELLDKSGFEWRCTVRDKYAYPFCDLEIFFDPNRVHGVDLRNYNKIRVWLDYDGPCKTLRMYLRNYDPLYSKLDDTSSTKYNMLEFSTDLLKNRMVEFSLSDFFVANWWVVNYKIPPELSHPQFENTVIFEIQTGTNNALGEHHFKLHRVELIGQQITTEKWYLFILVTWLCIFIVFLGYRIAMLTREVRLERKRAYELAEVNALLDAHTQALEERTKVDALTGAFNRQGVEEALRDGLGEWRRQKKPLSLVLMDIDHFKNINDSHGHAAGDYVLAEVSHIVKAHIRSNDLFARWGGEEFLLVCRNTQSEQARLIAEKIRTLIADYSFDDGIRVTSSFGVATLSANETLEQLFNAADKALYRAKHEGRNKVVVLQGGEI
ncbi:MAG: GGDEF domain-containing protein [Steroidobacter sp.]